MLQLAWLIPLLPIASWLIIVLWGKRFGEKAGLIGVVAVLLSLLISIGALFGVIAGGSYHLQFPWLVNGKVDIPLGIQVDPLTSIMLIVVTVVSSMVHIYSLGYMHGDSHFNRFYAVLSLFTAAMLGLVLADNFILLLISWEVMGLCSYLLIGHYYDKGEAIYASMKAFITTRVGDMGMIVGIIMLFVAGGTVNFVELAEKVEHHAISTPVLMTAALFLFAGAVGKSAQFPLHVWLPDAMAGPTPVSALIHAATMVAAGVYLVARSYAVFAPSHEALTVVAFIGAITALMAATIATVMTDIKKILAYSTISQLGYMVMALGVGGYAAGVFHLMTHAFFKALLFLGSGSVIHALHSQEVHEMGGLYKKMPVTATTWLIGTAALAGIPPFAGFWSKDEILLAAYHYEYPIIFWMGIAVAFLTAYYMTRATILTFFGRPRDIHKYEHAHESPAVMTVPLIILAILAFAAGFPGSPFMHHAISKFVEFHGLEEFEPSSFVMLLAIGMAAAGVIVGWAIYGANLVSREAAISILRPIYTVLKNKYYVDEVYHFVIVGGTYVIAQIAAWFDQRIIDFIVNAVGWFTVQVSRVAGWFDLAAVDGIVNGVGGGVVLASRNVRKLQTGQVQTYMAVLFVAVVIGVILFQVIGG